MGDSNTGAATNEPFATAGGPGSGGFHTAENESNEPAPRGKRVMAFVIDTIVVVVAAKLFGKGLSSVVHFVNPLYLIGLVFVLQMAIHFVYWIILPIEFDGTFGKRALGLRIVPTQSESLTYGQMVLREYVGRFFSSIVFMIGYIVALVSADGLAWHDKIAKTQVVVDRR